MTGPGAAPEVPFVAGGSYPVRPGNLVRPLVDGVPAFRRICEAIESARHSVWVTVTFFAAEFPMPDGRGSVLDVLDRAAERGLDVRVLFWRPNPESSRYGRAFAGSPEDRALLGSRGSRFHARWDRAPGAYCQHQKSWLLDAARPSERAFVGGVNPTPGNEGVPGHDGEGQRHDLYVEIAGPAATDVHHNFVQRWNEASERRASDGVWGERGDADLPFPACLSPAQGPSRAQIQRTLPPGRYRDGRASPGGPARDVVAGERSILEQYLQAIDAARRSIYIENQALPVPAVAARLEAALRRGVDVVVLVPANPEPHVRSARRDPGQRARFDAAIALAQYDRFALVGIAGRDARGGRSPVYVHAKAMLVDDAWATIGSCNLHAASLFHAAEMNASFWDPEVVRTLRGALLAEHLGQDTTHLDDRAALGLYRQIARDNRRRQDAGHVDWPGLAFTLDPAAYGLES